MVLHDFRRLRGRRHIGALVVFLALVFGVWFVPLASAHNSLIAVSLDCNGAAKYTATAWAGPTTASRTNTDVRVFRSIDGGRTWTQVGQGQFNQADRFSFSGTFSVGSSPSVRVMVQEFANWGDGVHPAGPGYASANRPSNCSPPSTTTTTTTTAPPPPTTTTTTTTTPPPPPPTTPTPPPAPPTPPPAPPVAPPAPALTIVKTERVGSTGTYGRGPVGAAVGETLDFQILVTNTGNTVLALTLTDVLCDGGTLHAGGATTLAPGAAVTYTCTHRLLSKDASPFVNTAVVTAATPTGARVGPASSAVSADRMHGVLGATFKKVVRKAKPAKAVVAPAHFTG
jgi:uncharacterized repeat protein (TIGR01451 family)